MPFRIHFIKNISFENPGLIKDWADSNGFLSKETDLYANQPLPDINSFDWLVIMGGPMSVGDAFEYPFLKKEKLFIESAIKANKLTLGICIGAQLIADVLGARVYKNEFKEIGWFPVSLTSEGKTSTVFKSFPSKFMTFQWHQDTFDIPSGAIALATSENCKNQAFLYDEHTVALQFHFEVKKENISNLIKHGSSDLTLERYVQTPEQMQNADAYFAEIKQNLYRFLNNLSPISY